MFTGLVQSLGTLEPLGATQLKITCLAPGDELAVAIADQPISHASLPHPILTDMALGDSIAVDGVCLTVASKLPRGFIATASPETLQKSTLGQLPPDAVVNLEASLRVGSKIGGHFVTGHVDGVGYLESSQVVADAWDLRFRVPDPRVTSYIVSKGSIAVNGISLTVADCSPSGDWFSVAVIPVTYQETNLGYLSPGQGVNLEADILGKYVAKFLQSGSNAPSSTGSANGSPAPAQPDLSLSFLAEHGYG